MKKKLCMFAVLMLLSAGIYSGAAAESYQYGAWMPYWEYDDSIQELNSLTDKLDKVIAFACIFDANDDVLMLDETESMLHELQKDCKGTGTAVYLSVVNDIEVDIGVYDNKNTDLLRRLFADEESMALHLESLVGLIDQYRLTGIELDYENIRTDTELWAQYTAFIEMAWSVCKRDGIQLRIVLPWNAPVYVDLPQGPEYSVMCYNLFGYHSGPGPKADVAFLQETCDYYQSLLPNVSMAFATGGFDWHDGEITSLTQQQAEENLCLADAMPIRNADSGALCAIYDFDGETHEVWYADAETLAIWRDTCVKNGYSSFDFFRLGGNDLNDWKCELLAPDIKGEF